MKKVKISVIIPSYNQLEYLPDAIESVLSQTILPHEVIIVYDGSTDGSLKVAQGYQTHATHLIKVISQVNKGLSSARNTGIMNATGDYCFFLDADDMMKENCLELITKRIQETNADIVAPSFKCFGLAEDIVILLKPKLEAFKEANRLGYFSAIKRSKLLEVGGYSPRMVWGYEDYHLWFDLLSRNSTVEVLQDILIMYRIKEKSMIHEAQAHHEELMNQIKKDFKKLYE